MPKVNIKFNKGSLSDFDAALNTILKNTNTASIRAIEEDCIEILNLSLAEVPRETDTLAASGYYNVKVKGTEINGEVGYGGNGDPINPLTGQSASYYMVAVHEDLSVRHIIGKAKYLEDPVRAYTQGFGDSLYSKLKKAVEG